MSKFTKMLAASPYAHLFGVAAAKADGGGDGDDEMKQGVNESDEDYAKRMEEKEKEDAKKAKKAAKADGDKQGDEESDEDYAKRMEEKEKEDAKKAKKAEDSDDDKEQAARASERARCAAIFKCSAAGTRPDLAAYLAFDTDMSMSAAVGMLSAAAAGGGRPAGLASRMASTSIPNVGAGGSPAASAATSSQALADRIIAADKRRRGEA